MSRNNKRKRKLTIKKSPKNPKKRAMNKYNNDNNK